MNGKFKILQMQTLGNYSQKMGGAILTLLYIDSGRKIMYTLYANRFAQGTCC